jgi:hypothetical protein
LRLANSSFQVSGSILFSILFLTACASGQLALSPSSVNFGSVQLGSTAVQSIALSNSGQSSTTVSQAALVGSGFVVSGPALPLALPAGQKAVFNVSFTPTVSGSTNGTVSFSTSITTIHDRSGKHNSTSSSTVIVSLTGAGAGLATASTPGQLAASPRTLAFATVQVGGSVTQSVTVMNSGGSNVNVAQATIAGDGFTLSGLAFPFSLAVGQSATFAVTFTPASAGSAIGGISIISDASNPTLTISLAGTGAAQGQLAITPLSANFGTVAVGTTQTQRGTLTASGSSVTVSSGSVTSSEFSLSGIALPLTLAAGHSVPFTMTFAPQQSGTASASVSFTSNATNSVAETLTGDGAVPPSHYVNLSWSDASGAVGYNVYRGSQSAGPYSKINPVLGAGTTYVDSSVQGGQSYFYVTTAVNSSGAQSGYSNETQAVVPSP